jgi:CRP/FNR family cyclic AMP-dependent transcriptional regulator
MRGTWRWPPRTLLGSISEASRQRLLESGTIREYPADHRLITQGDCSTFVIVLLEGVVKAAAVSSAGREVLLAIRVGGDLIGEFAAVDGQPRSNNVTTCGPVTGCVITQAGFLADLSRDKSLAQAVDRAVVAKARAGNERRMEFAGFDAHTRFARIIRELAVLYGERSGNRVTISWPVTQSELASLASVAEPTAQKALRRLRETGVISTGYRSLTVQDFTALDRIAGALTLLTATGGR